MRKWKRHRLCCVCTCIVRKKKKCCSRCRFRTKSRKKKRCRQRKRSLPVIFPVIKKKSITKKNITVEKTIVPGHPERKPHKEYIAEKCCGNILLTHTTPEMLLWERDPAMNVQMVQITVSNSANSTERMKLRTEPGEKHEMDIFPGNTVNYWSQRTQRLYVYVTDHKPATFVEGKYTVRATFPSPEQGDVPGTS